MACSTIETDYQDLLDRLNEVKAIQKGLTADAQAARQPQHPARETVKKSFQREREITHKAHAAFNDFRHVGEFCKSVREITTAGGNWQAHAKMNSWVKGYSEYQAKAAPTGMNETVGADGGFLVPPEFANQLLERTYDNDLLSRTMLFPMTSNKLDIPAVNETSRADGSRFGGVVSYWDGEAITGTTSKPGFHKITLTPNGLYAVVKATDDLLNDSGTAMESFVNRVVPQELTFNTGAAIVRGDGVNKPLGILNSPALVTVTKEANQPAATIQHENIVKMYARMFGPCRSNAVWLINQDAEPALHTMTLGTAGSQLASYLPAGGLSGAPYATLMGRPVLPVEFCSTLGTVGDILFVDLGSYLTGTIGGIVTAVSMHIYFLSNEQAFRFRIRIDGKPWWTNPLTPYQGTATQSPFVALATRS